MSDTVETCCLCGHKFPSKEMHNAEPVVEKGRCCEACNRETVLPYRFGVLLHNVNYQRKEITSWQKQKQRLVTRS